MNNNPKNESISGREWKPEMAGWASSSEWKEMEEKLWRLSLSQLKELTKNVGIKFTLGDKNLDKEDYIRVLDEVRKERLITEHEKIISEK